MIEGFGGGVDGKGAPTTMMIDGSRDRIVELQSQEPMCLPPSIARNIAKTMKRVETALGQPVEAEFVFDINTKILSIVQVSPMTCHELSDFN